MSKKLLVCLISVVSFGICLSGCDEDKLPSVSFSKGQEFSRKINFNSNLQMMFPADNKKTEMILDFCVTDVDEEGVATVEVTIASIKADMKTIGMAPFSFDSEDATPPTKSKDKRYRHALNFYNTFIDLKGKKYSAQVDKHGRVIKLLNIDPRIKKETVGIRISQLVGSDQVRMLLTESNLKEYVSPALFCGLEKIKGRKNGRVWSGTSDICVPDIPVLSLQKEYTFEKQSSSAKEPMVVPYKVTSFESLVVDKDGKLRGRFEPVSVVGEGKVTFVPTKMHEIKLKETVVVGVKPNKGPKARGRQVAGKDKKKTKVNMAYRITKTIETIDN